MSRTQSVAQYIQQLAYTNILAREEREVRPDDAQAQPGEPAPHYAAWNATSFSAYVPFRDPTISE